MDSFKTLEDRLKLAGAVLGIFTLGITGGSYYSYGSDAFAFAMTILAFAFSLVSVILLLLKKMPSNDKSIKIEGFIYLVFAVLLSIGCIVFAVNTSKGFGYGGLGGLVVHGNRNTRIAATVFQILGILVYGAILVIIFKKIKK